MANLLNQFKKRSESYPPGTRSGKEFRRFVGQSIVKRTPLHHSDVPFILCWSQKAGCTTILKWFLSHAGLLEEALEHQDKDDLRLDIHSYENKVFKARKGYRVELVDQLCAGQLPVICFLRCPFERAFSSYMQINSNKFPAIFYNGRLSVGMKFRQKILLSLYNDESLMEYPISFFDYLNWLKGQDLTKVDKHHAPQITPLLPELEVQFFRLSDFNKVARSLEEKYGLKNSESIPGLTSAGHHVEKSNVNDAAAIRLLDHGVPMCHGKGFPVPLVNRPLLSGTRYEALIREIFAADIEQFDSIPAFIDDV